MSVAPADSKRRILTIVQALSSSGTERGRRPGAIAAGEGGVQVWSGPESLDQQRGQSEPMSWQVIHIHNGGQFDPYSDWLAGLLKGPTTRVVETNVFARGDYGPKPDPIDFEILISQFCSWKWRRPSPERLVESALKGQNQSLGA